MESKRGLWRISSSPVSPDNCCSFSYKVKHVDLLNLLSSLSILALAVVCSLQNILKVTNFVTIDWRHCCNGAIEGVAELGVRPAWLERERLWFETCKYGIPARNFSTASLIAVHCICVHICVTVCYILASLNITALDRCSLSFCAPHQHTNRTHTPSHRRR